ncbi:hypothetical protein TWF730_009001 [Orbilia blumenaviensis]|uniref:C2H2-domain containing protein second zinc finger domain-containing protein n=1 Tax=Orbilia blumenaviensis TaxID=1796055 RepID=A0AAV9UXR3_9PEZI
MDQRYRESEDNQHDSGGPSKSQVYQNPEGEYWGTGNTQPYENPPAVGPPPIDPRLQYEAAASPTILPPGTSVANYGGYRPAGYPGYTSSTPLPTNQYYEQSQQPSDNEAHEYVVYEYGGQDGSSPYSQSQQQASGEVHSPGPDRPRPEKKYLCTFAECEKSVQGNGFTTLNDLERHGRSKHGDDGQYIECRHERCPDKGKRFPRRDNFVDHYWRVHGQGTSKENIKPYALEKAREWMVVKQAGSWSQR